LHCLILRGARGTVARCWSGGTRLNGERFADARLSAGDRLAIGPIELEVITAAEADALRHEAADDKSPTVPTPEQGPADEQALHATRQRARRLIATIRDLRTEIEQLRHQPQAPATVEVPTLEASVDSRLEAFQRGCRQWEQSRSAREAELDARAHGLEADLQDLEAARGALSAQRQRWEQDNELSRRIRAERDAASVESQQRITEARLVVDQQQRELDAQREELSRLALELEQQRAELPARFAAQLAELEREQTDWKAQQTELTSQLASERVSLDARISDFEHAQWNLAGQQSNDHQRHEQAADQLVADRLSLEQERSEWQQRATEQDVVYQQRLREIAEQGAQLAAEREALAQREAHVATSEAQYQSERDEIQQLRAELDRRPAGEHQQMDTERQQRLEELERFGSQLAEQQAQAQQQQDAMAAAQARLERALADLEDQREKLDAERVAAADRLARESAELQRQRIELEQQQAALESARAAGMTEAVEPNRAEEDDEEEKVKELVSNLRSRLAAAAEEEDEEEEMDDEPRARVRAADEDEDEEDEEDDVPVATDERPSAGRGGDTKSADDDMSVEEYMKALLSRARGGQPAVAPSQAAPPQRRNKRKSDAPAKAVEAKPEATPEPASVAQVIDMPEAPLQLVRRVPVQQTADFGAMRELANTQARIAIDLHGKKRLLRIAVGSITGAAIAVAVTLTVLFVVSDDVALRTGSMVGIVAAVYWMYGGATALQKMMGLQQTSRAELLAQLAQAEARKS
jgi:hypothetical protein